MACLPRNIDWPFQPSNVFKVNGCCICACTCIHIHSAGVHVHVHVDIRVHRLLLYSYSSLAFFSLMSALGFALL